MAAFDYTRRRADVQSDFERNQLMAEQGRKMGQKRFARNRAEMVQGFGRQFPQVTGRMAGRLGSGIRSGVANQQLGRFVGGFQQNLGDLDVSQSMAEAQFIQDEAARRAAYQRMLQTLEEDFARSRLGQNPFERMM